MEYKAITKILAYWPKLSDRALTYNYHVKNIPYLELFSLI